MLYYFETNCNFYFETIYCTLHFFGRRLERNGSKPPEQDPSDSKSSQLHIRHLMAFLYSFEVYSIDSSKMIGNSYEVSNFNQLFLKTQPPVHL